MRKFLRNLVRLARSLKRFLPARTEPVVALLGRSAEHIAAVDRYLFGRGSGPLVLLPDLSSDEHETRERDEDKSKVRVDDGASCVRSATRARQNFGCRPRPWKVAHATAAALHSGSGDESWRRAAKYIAICFRPDPDCSVLTEEDATLLGVVGSARALGRLVRVAVVVSVPDGSGLEHACQVSLAIPKGRDIIGQLERQVRRSDFDSGHELADPRWRETLAELLVSGGRLALMVETLAAAMPGRVDLLFMPETRIPNDRDAFVSWLDGERIKSTSRPPRQLVAAAVASCAILVVSALFAVGGPAPPALSAVDTETLATDDTAWGLFERDYGDYARARQVWPWIDPALSERVRQVASARNRAQAALGVLGALIVKRDDLMRSAEENAARLDRDLPQALDTASKLGPGERRRWSETQLASLLAELDMEETGRSALESVGERLGAPADVTTFDTWQDAIGKSAAGFTLLGLEGTSGLARSPQLPEAIAELAGEVRSRLHSPPRMLVVSTTSSSRQRFCEALRASLATFDSTSSAAITRVVPPEDAMLDLQSIDGLTWQKQYFSGARIANSLRSIARGGTAQCEGVSPVPEAQQEAAREMLRQLEKWPRSTEWTVQIRQEGLDHVCWRTNPDAPYQIASRGNSGAVKLEINATPEGKLFILPSAADDADAIDAAGERCSRSGEPWTFTLQELQRPERATGPVRLVAGGRLPLRSGLSNDHNDKEDVR